MTAFKAGKPHQKGVSEAGKRHYIMRVSIGKFPYDYVSSVLELGPTPPRNIPSEYAYPAHGSSDMPTWGPIFQYHDKQNERVVTQRIKNLCDYLASLQEH